MGLLLVLLLVILLVGALPTYPYSRGWGPYPAGGVGLLLLLLVVLILLDVVHWGRPFWGPGPVP